MDLQEVETELINLARRDTLSTLRNRAYGGLCEENWMTGVTNELLLRCPTLAKILSSLLDYDLSNPGKKLPPMCLIYAIVLFWRCHELSKIQRINTILLTEGRATTNVCNYILVIIICLSTVTGKFCNTQFLGFT